MKIEESGTWEQRRERERRRWRQILVLIAFGAVVVTGMTGLLIVGLRTGDSHEDGHSVGTLINVRNEGMLWSRPAATLVHTGEMKGDEFALDPSLLERANAFADAGVRVKVTYVARYVCWAWNYASCTIITAIDPDLVESSK